VGREKKKRKKRRQDLARRATISVDEKGEKNSSGRGKGQIAKAYSSCLPPFPCSGSLRRRGKKGCKKKPPLSPSLFSPSDAKGRKGKLWGQGGGGGKGRKMVWPTPPNSTLLPRASVTYKKALGRERKRKETFSSGVTIHLFPAQIGMFPKTLQKEKGEFPRKKRGRGAEKGGSDQFWTSVLSHYSTAKNSGKEGERPLIPTPSILLQMEKKKESLAREGKEKKRREKSLETGNQPLLSSPEGGGGRRKETGRGWGKAARVHNLLSLLHFADEGWINFPQLCPGATKKRGRMAGRKKGGKGGFSFFLFFFFFFLCWGGGEDGEKRGDKPTAKLSIFSP